ncbi:MAG: GNAT family N-acetyltransferase [Mycobacteriaceae bacterium]|nr:GNAT family N-acetyltransferase [Mycobacteriaceae bacterium]
MTATATLTRSYAYDLDTAQLYNILKLRAEVFVIEQKSSYQDLDGLDLLPETRHLWLTENGQVIAYLRLSEQHEDGKSFLISRVCTAPEHRGQGHTTRLLRTALADVGGDPCRMNAQSYLVDMYTKHGFRPDGPEFDEAGVPHVPLRRGGGDPWKE